MPLGKMLGCHQHDAAPRRAHEESEDAAVVPIGSRSDSVCARAPSRTSANEQAPPKMAGRSHRHRLWRKPRRCARERARMTNLTDSINARERRHASPMRIPPRSRDVRRRAGIDESRARERQHSAPVDPKREPVHAIASAARLRCSGTPDGRLEPHAPCHYAKLEVDFDRFMSKLLVRGTHPGQSTPSGIQLRHAAQVPHRQQQHSSPAHAIRREVLVREPLLRTGVRLPLALDDAPAAVAADGHPDPHARRRCALRTFGSTERSALISPSFLDGRG